MRVGGHLRNIPRSNGSALLQNFKVPFAWISTWDPWGPWKSRKLTLPVMRPDSGALRKDRLGQFITASALT